MRILCVLSRYAYGRPERGENYDYVHFLPALERLGHEVSFFDSGYRPHHRDFAALNVALLERVANFRPDVIFCVLMHYEIWLETLDLIRASSPALVVNWGTDDSWKFAPTSCFHAEHVDLHVTTDLRSAKAAPSLGLDNVYLSQWAGSLTAAPGPLQSCECRYDVSFIGSMYGYRAAWIAALRGSGVSVTCFGHGTENGVVEADEIPRIFRESRISLNFSGPGVSSHSGARQIKARTFEVPAAGGFLLTETAPGLDQYLEPGREIATFSSPDELIKKTRHYLDHPDQRDTIALAGYARTIADHTYEARFAEILKQLQASDRCHAGASWTLSADALAGAVERHRNNSKITWIRAGLAAILSAAFGRERGQRAARRLLFELSWRICGATTYTSRGLPGRLFYSES